MDPTACLRRINDADRIDSLDCREAIADLARWIANGGFAPAWSVYSRGARRFARRCPNLYAIEGQGPDAFKAKPRISGPGDTVSHWGRNA